MAATLRVPDDFEEKDGCFLVNFTNGQLLPSAQDKTRFTLYHKTNDKTKRRKIMVAETDHLTYVGTNYDPDSVVSSSTSTCRYCIGALDKTTGVMTLHKAEQFTLKPHIPGMDSVDAPEEETPVKPASLDKMVNLFGSEKQKRAFSAAKRNLLETVAHESALATAVSHAQEELKDTSTTVASYQQSGLMPPHNPAAELPQDVYKLEDIISLGELKQLRKTAKVFTKATMSDVKQWTEENKFPGYVLEHISSLPTSEPQRSLKAAILLYISYLIKIHNMKARKIAQEGFKFESSIVPPPGEVNQQLLCKFTERQEGAGKGGQTVYSLTARMKDKIRLHLFVLTLIVDDFSVSCVSLQKDLKLTTAKMMDHYRALGCAVTKSTVKRKSPDDSDTTPSTGSSCTAVLKIPLNFPKPRRGKR